MTRGRLCMALAAAAPLLAWAQAPDQPTSVELAYGRESLSNGSPDWQETTLDIGHRLAAREYLGASLRRTGRFGLSRAARTCGCSWA